MIRASATVAALAALSLASVAGATPVRFVALGHVEYNQFFSNATFYGQAGLPTITPCRLEIVVDSNNFLDNTMYPVRGYVFGANDITMTIGTVSVHARSTETVNYLCIRNNDPHVDGVFISKGNGFDTEIPLAIVPNNYGVGFLRTFTSETVFPSTDILQCTGSWAYESMSSYNFGIQRGEGSVPLGIWYDSFSITAKCGEADLGQQGGADGFDGALDNNDFIVFINKFFAMDPVADQGRQGGLQGNDGFYDNNDFIAFISNFFNGCV
ncbi:MAG: GC-type dockerin domain-anchored protein [Phycisphaerales bacterium]